MEQNGRAWTRERHSENRGAIGQRSPRADRNERNDYNSGGHPRRSVTRAREKSRTDLRFTSGEKCRYRHTEN
jgi:hypothetical protein